MVRGHGRASYLYDPYGEASIRNADYSQKGTGLVTASGYNWRILFGGGQYDTKTGLYIFEHRPYNVTLGWLLHRSNRISGRIEPLCALGNNPIRFTDPTGL